MKQTLKKVEEKMILSDFDTKGRKPNAYGGRIGYDQGIGPVGERQYSPTKGKDWIQTMPKIDPRLRDLIKEYKKRKGLAEILGV